MRNLLFFAFILVLNSVANAQDLSIELTVTWRTCAGVPIIVKDERICKLPALVITYKNLSQRKIYFRGLTQPGARFIEFPEEFVLPSALENWIKLLPNRKKSVDTVAIGPIMSGGYRLMWEGVRVKNNEISKPNTIDPFNYSISNLQYAFQIQAALDKANSGKKLDFFEDCCKQGIDLVTALKLYYESDLERNHDLEFTERDIYPAMSESVLSEFLFLKEGEVHIDTLDLSAFWMLGGTFDFSVRSPVIESYLLGDPVLDSKTERWVYKKLNLPVRVLGHELFSGKFLTNSVKVVIE